MSSEGSSELSVVDLLKNQNEQDFKILTEASILYLIDKDKLERLNTLNKTIEQIENSKEITKFMLKQLNILLQADQPKISKHFQSNFGLEDSKISIIKTLWEKHADSLKDQKNSQSLMISQLVDMEWKFGVTASTNHIDKLGNAFLQLKLVYNNGGKLDSKYMELTLPQFYSFLFEMNKAKSQMEYLS
ncbi:unnamed protein product [Brachionus calyciflorus]|uniref:COMM domain-containing protein n=1 Tax=Brachionus calyciflorus TaxID=104777 RepID=A0A813M2E7_9BILA|nr:unnamed protein product [Brachionus calyciflorus]